jgi:hypothetical protein
VGGGSADVGLVRVSPGLGHLGEDLLEQTEDDLELVATDLLVGTMSGAAVLGHPERRIRSFRPEGVPVETKLLHSKEPGSIPNYGTQQVNQALALSPRLANVTP